jgi:hypothetical protein
LFSKKEKPKIVPLMIQHTEKVKDKPLECHVPHKHRWPLFRWVKRFGIAGFLFFLIKGLLWLIIPYLIAKGILN